MVDGFSRTHLAHESIHIIRTVIGQGRFGSLSRNAPLYRSFFSQPLCGYRLFVGIISSIVARMLP
jgi:hypothetical protein